MVWQSKPYWKRNLGVKTKSQRGRKCRYEARILQWLAQRICFSGVVLPILLLASSMPIVAQEPLERGAKSRPNFVFAIADDWGWPHASALGDQGISTPVFDRIAKQGVLFTQAFVSSPSCTPSRGAIITGQHFWRLRGGANLWPDWPENQFAEFPKLLKNAGYHVGHYRKAWGPGKSSYQPGGKTYRSVDSFFDARNKDQPFCFWFGSSDPHRGYKPGSGRQAGIDPNKVHLFPWFPSRDEVRNDVADYYFEVQRFDRQVGQLLDRLSEMGELENTIVIMTSDHGMPFPRCKGNVYDSGTRVPFSMMGPGIQGNRQVKDLISLTDVAPTFLEAAGQKVPVEMTGRSLWKILKSSKSGIVDKSRAHVLFGRERHVIAQEKGNRGGYPVRALRTQEFLFVRNFEPERWPSGTPDYQNAERGRAWLADCDNGPTKASLWTHRKDARIKLQYELCFAKRPAEELYDLKRDPYQTRNLAENPTYRKTRDELSQKLVRALKQAKDPRIQGNGGPFDEYPYYGGAPQFMKSLKK